MPAPLGTAVALGAVLLAFSASLQGCGEATTTTTTTTSTSTDGGGWGPAECFVEPSYDKRELQVLEDIAFSVTYSRQWDTSVTLRMDAYFPPGSDRRATRPVVVLLHGGSFIEGSRTTDGMPAFAAAFAQRGFVAVSIDYRLANPEVVWHQPTVMLQAVQEAREDAATAVRFIKARAADWRIDPGRIALFGYSAGGITALYYAYVSASLGGPSLADSNASSVRGVMVVSGELKAQAFCQSLHPVTREPLQCLANSPPFPDFTSSIASGEVPAVLMHGDMDTTVPYVNARAVLVAARAAGVRAELFTAKGADHHTVLDALQNVSEPFFRNLTRFASGMLNLARAECPYNASAKHSGMFI